MKNFSHIQDQIEAYLENRLSSEEMTAFEAELLANPSLKNELDLQREIQDYLSDSKSVALGSNLLKLRDSIVTPTPIPAKTNTRSKYLFISAVLLALITVSFFMFNLLSSEPAQPEVKETTPKVQQDSKTQENNTDKVENTGTKDKDIDIQSKTKEEPSTDKTLHNSKTKTLHNPPKKKLPIDESLKSTQTFAMADFEANKSLELLINGRTRSRFEELEVLEKTKDQKWVDNIPVDVIFNANVDTSIGLVKEDISFYLFSNKKEAYDSFLPLNTANPNVTKVKDGFNLLIDKKMMLKPGLYYYIIETTEEEELIYIDKFIVK